MLFEHERLESQPLKPLIYQYGWLTNDLLIYWIVILDNMENKAWTLGSKAWGEVENTDVAYISDNINCSWWKAMSGEDMVILSNYSFLMH